MLEDVSSGNEAGIQPENTARDYNADIAIVFVSCLADSHVNLKATMQRRKEIYEQLNMQNQQN